MSILDPTSACAHASRIWSGQTALKQSGLFSMASVIIVKGLVIMVYIYVNNRYILYKKEKLFYISKLFLPRAFVQVSMVSVSRGYYYGLHYEQ